MPTPFRDSKPVHLRKERDYIQISCWIKLLAALRLRTEAREDPWPSADERENDELGGLRLLKFSHYTSDYANRGGQRLDFEAEWADGRAGGPFTHVDFGIPGAVMTCGCCNRAACLRS